MALWKLTTREIALRPGRAVLTTLSIGIGMAAIVSVNLSTATTREAYRRMYEQVAGRAALQVTAQGGAFAEDLVTTVQRVDGVAAAVPSVQRRTLLYFGKRKLSVLVVGIDPIRDMAARDYQMREGHFFADGGEKGALLEAGFAESVGIRLGDEVRVMTPHGTPILKRLTITGLLAPRGAAGFNRGSVVFMPLGLAERYFTGPRDVTAIDLVLRDGADEQTVAECVRRSIPGGFAVYPLAARTQLAKKTSLLIELCLQLSSLFALALAMIIVCNTFLMNVSERRRQLAILRVLGATRGQILRMLSTESFVMGAIGSVLGCVVGAGGGYLLMALVTRVNTGSAPPIVFSPWAFVLAAFLGPTIAVGSAGCAAWPAMRISPLEAMQPMVTKDGHWIPRALTLSGVFLVMVSGSMLAVSLRSHTPPLLCILSGVLLAVSLVLLIPWIVRPLAFAFAWICSPVLGLEGRLAHRQIRRWPVRTALTAGVLYIAVTMGIGQGTVIINCIDDVRIWERRTNVADFFLRADFADTTTGQAIELPAQLANEIRNIPDVTNMDTISVFDVSIAGQRAFAVAGDFTGADLPIDLYRGDPSLVRQRLLAGEVVLGTVLAQQTGVQPGDEITLDTRQGARPFRVAALTIDYMVGGHIIYMHRALAQRLFGVEGASMFLIRALPDARPAVQSSLEALAKRHGLMLHSAADLSRMVESIAAGVVSGLWGIRVLGFVVAALGIANTLTMNVLDQTRELAVLRVVGMTRRQVHKTVLSQAVLIGLIGLLLGLFVGIFAAYVINLVMLLVLGFPVPLVFDPDLLLGCSLAVIGLVLAAALLPARRAARLDLLTALQYE